MKLTTPLLIPHTGGWEVSPGASRGEVIVAHATHLPHGLLLPDARAALEAFEEPQLAPGADWALVTDPVFYLVLGRAPVAHIALMTAGAYTAQWLDLDALEAGERAPIFADGGDLRLDAPHTGRWGLILRRVGR